ncbi:MAG: class I SAM-dependent RNA methyltransferase [Sandaracinus sp.]|nr:class I SAM-dependent RNA methyltransferase [Sandaracinus sp.]
MVDHVASGGDGVLQDGRDLVYVAGAFVGDRVRVERRGANATLLEVLSAGPERREPSCDAVGTCGGCPWMAWDYPHQRAHKKALVERCVGREVELVGSDDLGYRRRAFLSFRQGSLGFLRDRSDRVVDRKACVVLAAPLQHALTALRKRLLPKLKGRGEIGLARSLDRAVATIRTVEAQPPEAYEACRALLDDGFAGLALTWEGAAPAVFGDPVERTLGADGEVLVGTLGGFSQAHDVRNDELVRRVVDWAKPEGAHVLELHAGHGNLGVMLARGSSSYVGVEIDPEAVRSLASNLQARGLSGKAVVADAAAYPKGSYDVVVLDPPRRGAAEVIPRLVQERPERIVYVSCAPTALQRDLAPLLEAGYAVDEACAFDLFPQTPHVETVVRLHR